MKVLIIPEDQLLDGYIVKPVIESLMQDVGLTARVDVLGEPRLRGAAEALNARTIADIVAENPMADLFLLIVDRDCDRDGNVARARAREAEHAGRLIACVAIHEVEVWLLALHKDRLGVPFSEVRAECDPKERFAEPPLRELGAKGAGRGRKVAMRALRGKWSSLRDTCSELRELRDAISAWRGARA